jgi:voltage-gated potassium channel
MAAIGDTRSPGVTPAEESRADRLSDRLSLPMAILAVVWVLVIVAELVAPSRGRSSRLLSGLSTGLWLVFLVDFALELAMAPDRSAFMRKHWATTLSVILPVFSVLRLFGAVAAVRAAVVARGAFAATSAPAAIARVLVKNRLVQVLVVLTLVVPLGAAGIFAAEAHGARGAFSSFGFTVYWAACVATTVNFGPEPLSLAGRLLAMLLRICGVAFFGVVAGGLASLIFGVRLGRPERPPPRVRTDAPPPPELPY